MEQKDIVAAIKTLPEERLAELLNYYFDWVMEDKIVLENTAKNLNMVFCDASPSDIVSAVAEADGGYSSRDKWFVFEGEKLISANTLKDLFPYFDDYVKEMAEYYPYHDLNDEMNDIIDVAVGKENEKSAEMQVELQLKKAEDRGERKLLSLLNAMKHRGAQDKIDQVLEDDNLRLSYYREYNII